MGRGEKEWHYWEQVHGGKTGVNIRTVTMVNQARQSVGRQTGPAGGFACTPVQDRPGKMEGVL